MKLPLASLKKEQHKVPSSAIKIIDVSYVSDVFEKHCYAYMLILSIYISLNFSYNYIIHITIS